MLQIVIFSILFGIGLALAPEHAKTHMMNFSESLAETMFKMTGIIMYFAPIAVGCAMAYSVGHVGIQILKNLMYLVLTLYGALIVFIVAVLVPIALYFKINIKKLAQHISEPVSIAFATTSSDSALPKLMLALEKMGCSRKIVSFVLPMGYSFNLDGTTLYLSLATIFVAQVSKIDLTWGQQISILLTLMLTSKGVAGVPRASLVILLGMASSLNLPLEPIFLIFGVDELMDMARTSTNVIGNSLATCVIAKSEGELQEV
jgi:proton glutamate symport protein